MAELAYREIQAGEVCTLGGAQGRFLTRMHRMDRMMNDTRITAFCTLSSAALAPFVAMI